MDKLTNVVNKKAKFEYTFIRTLTSGIKLVGSEVKSIRQGKVSISEGYCYFNDGELFIKGMTISDYGYGSSHVINRDRKLLLKRKELNKLEKDLINGLTIIPYRVFINESGLIKMDVVLSKGKKIYDKREDIKKKDIDRDIQRHLK
jgi:SsrA-binding protein|tara:strand:+ start:1643 stop:2080 length:438 start_codon:yes stop_codon:yes gene_type:complete